MGYHPETLAFSFPPYASKGIAKLLYRLKPWIGVDIWHIDPERRSEGQRTDDSCGWFDRRPGPYGPAMTEFLADEGDMQELQNAFAVKVFWKSAYLKESGPAGGWDRLTPADTLAGVLMVATHLEHRRYHMERNRLGWPRSMFVRRHDVLDLATSLALNPTDNLASCESPEALVRSVASALHRRFRPWWRHPRWHVHHWQVNISLVRNIKRMFHPCATCGRGIGFGKSPLDDGAGLHHLECRGVGVAGKSVSA